jgi:DNA-binding MarR family transcriptional regulator
MKDARLLPNEFKVALALLSHANAETFAIYPSRELLAIETGLSQRTVSRLVKSLVSKGWLKVTRANKHVQNSYEFLTDNIEPIENIHREARDVLADRRKRRREVAIDAARDVTPEVTNAADLTAVSPQNQSGPATGGTSDLPPVAPEHLKTTPKVEALNTNTEEEAVPQGVTSAASVISKAVTSQPANSAIPVENGVQLTQPLMVLRDGRLAHVANVDGEVIGTFPTEAQAFLGLVRLRKKHGLPNPPNPWAKPNPITGKPIVPADFDAMLEEQGAKQERRDRLNDRDAA